MTLDGDNGKIRLLVVGEDDLALDRRPLYERDGSRGVGVRARRPQGSGEPTAKRAAVLERPPDGVQHVRRSLQAGRREGGRLRSLERSFGRTVLKQLPAEDVVNLQSVDRLPLLLAALIVLLGVMTLGNTLVTSVRRRRRDLAVLKTIGFVRPQVAAVVAWQATSFALLALLVGLPVGIVGVVGPGARLPPELVLRLLRSSPPLPWS